MFEMLCRWFSIEVVFRPLRARKRRPARRRKAFLARFTKPAFEPLESREMLTGEAYINAQNDPSGGGYTVLNTTPFTVAAPGVLANDTDSGGYQMTAILETSPAHGAVTLNGDGSFTYTATPGYTGPDSFTYYDTDTQGDPSSTATVSFFVYAGALSDADQTRIPADTLTVPMQILGTSSGQPATAGNLSLVYHSSTAQPTQTLEQDWQPSMTAGTSDELQVLGAINGLQPAAAYINTGNLSQNNPVVRLSVEVDTSTLATGRYADTQTVDTMVSEGDIPISTLNGAVNVVNDQSSPFGAGWEMPGLYHLLSKHRRQRAGRRAAHAGRRNRLVLHSSRRQQLYQSQRSLRLRHSEEPFRRRLATCRQIRHGLHVQFIGRSHEHRTAHHSHH